MNLIVTASSAAILVTTLTSNVRAEDTAPSESAGQWRLGRSGDGERASTPAELDRGEGKPALEEKLEPVESAAETLINPFTVSARTQEGSMAVKTVAGYDTASEAFVARSVLEGRVVSFLTLRIDFEHAPGMGPDDRLGAGARVQALNSKHHGIDGGVGVFYQPNDFREEGSVFGGLLLGRSFKRFAIYGNVFGGADPEGDDATVEGRIGGVARVHGAVRVGWDNRFRYNMSDDEKAEDTEVRDWEFQSLPSFSYTLGPVVLLAEAGLSMVQITAPFGAQNEESSVESGLLAMAGVGGAF